MPPVIEPLFVRPLELRTTCKFVIVPVALFMMSPERELSVIEPLFVMSPEAETWLPRVIEPLFVMLPDVKRTEFAIVLLHCL